MKRVLKIKAVDALGRPYSYYKILNKFNEDDTELHSGSKGVDSTTRGWEDPIEPDGNGTSGGQDGSNDINELRRVSVKPRL